MMDPILEDRLSALEQSLARAKDPSNWKAKLDLHNVEVEDRIWNLAIMDIRREASRIIDELDDIKRQVHAGNSGSAEWQRYNEIHQASQELCRDSLELVGGLALRDKLLDQEICQLTDELILNCSENMITITNTSPTIPAHLELTPRMLKRVVRMRFSEWTLWTLPLAAYEFGLIAIEEVPELQSFCKKQAEEAARTAEAATDYNTPDGNDRLQHAIRYVKILMADAFATYTLGPAYACPAVLLEFSPIPGGPGLESGPSGARRAELVLSILQGMGQSENSDNENAFDFVLKQLRQRWGIIQQPADNRENIILDPADVLDIFSMELHEFRPQVRYPTTLLNQGISGGWPVARQWQEHWRNELTQRTGKLTIPDTVRGTSKLRDGLNAAWLCRLRIPPADLTYVETAAKELCMEIVSERSATKRSSGRRQANPRPKYKG